MIKCKICGVEKKYSIVEHLKYKHDMKSREYKEKFNAPVKSDELKKLVSENSKKVWADSKYKSKMCKIQKKSHNTEEYKKKASENTKKVWKNEEYRQNQIDKHKTPEFLETIRNPDRIEKIRKSTMERWKDPEYRKKTVKRMKEVINEKDSGYRKYLESEKWKENKKKISDTIATKIANGEIGYGTNNHFKNGWYENKIDKYWYQSGLELDTMKFFDDNENVIGWTNKHGIRIKYIHPDGRERNYIPDFLIKLKNNKEILIEMKGFGDKKEIIAKKDAAEKIYNNYHLVYSIKKLKEIINNEINEN